MGGPECFVVVKGGQNFLEVKWEGTNFSHKVFSPFDTIAGAWGANIFGVV